MRTLEVEHLTIILKGSYADIVHDVSFSAKEGEIVALVGESGSGKTTVGLSLLAHTRQGAAIGSGEVMLGGEDVLTLSPREVRAKRGAAVAYVPQDPGAGLNPALRVGRQVEEVLETHKPEMSAAERDARIAELFSEVRLSNEAEFARRYPHQLSGGQQQRVALAMAFACRPRLIVLDEPTTGLDVTTQAHVLETVRELCRSHGVAAVYVTHDLAVVEELADRIVVLYAGTTVETGPTASVFSSPAHPYTRGLLAAVPRLDLDRRPRAIAGTVPPPGSRPNGCRFAPRCELAIPECSAAVPDWGRAGPDHLARCIRLEEAERRDIAATEAPAPRTYGGVMFKVENAEAWYGGTHVLHDVSFDVRAGECVAVVGESGSGKTTLSRYLVGLHRDGSGKVTFDGVDVPTGARRRSADLRRRIQYVFQNPYASLNSRKTIAQIMREPLSVFSRVSGVEAQAKVSTALAEVSLSSRVEDCYPTELSGGERQRVAIARALICNPNLIICDEITSALDVSVQAAIVELLQELQRNAGVSLVFVTHDLALVRSIAARVVVLHQGRVVESGEVDAVFVSPTADYTRNLLEHTPSLDGPRENEMADQ